MLLCIVSLTDHNTCILSRATYHRTPGYDGMRTLVEGLLVCGTYAFVEIIQYTWTVTKFNTKVTGGSSMQKLVNQ